MHRRAVSPGQALIEFALITPLFLTITFAIIEYSWAMYGYNTVQSAANEGARRAMVLNRPASTYGLAGNSSGTAQPLSGCRPATIVGTIACSIGVLPAGRVTVDVSVPNPSSFPNPGQNVAPGKTVTVIVNYSYIPLFSRALSFSPNYTIRGYATAQTQ